MDDGRLRDLFPAEHAGDLRNPLLGIVEPPDSRARVPAGVLFPDEEVRGGEAGDLRQMRDTNDLIAGGELLKLAADHFGHAPADAGVNLVKEKSGRCGSWRSLE